VGGVARCAWIACDVSAPVQIKLVAIQCDGSLTEDCGLLPERTRDIVEQTVRLYKSVCWNFPWVGYLAFEDDKCVGTCAFKGAPKNDVVEIAYHTFPEFEGRGIATQMAKQLCSIAKQTSPNILVTAQTLPAQARFRFERNCRRFRHRYGMGMVRSIRRCTGFCK